MILTNGPGTCVMIIIASRILSFLRITGRARVIFIESFARVKKLSLSGKILLRFNLTDRFLVMWQELADAYKGVEYVGIVV